MNHIQYLTMNIKKCPMCRMYLTDDMGIQIEIISGGSKLIVLSKVKRDGYVDVDRNALKFAKALICRCSNCGIELPYKGHIDKPSTGLLGKLKSLLTFWKRR